MTEANTKSFPTPEEIEKHMARARQLRAAAYREALASLWNWRSEKAEAEEKSYKAPSLAKPSGAAA